MALACHAPVFLNLGDSSFELSYQKESLSLDVDVELSMNWSQQTICLVPFNLLFVSAHTPWIMHFAYLHIVFSLT